MGNLRYKGYVGSVEYSEEDDCFVGSVLGLHRDCIIFEGDTVKALKKDFEQSIDDYLEGCRVSNIEPDKPYSGKIVLRMSSDLHSNAAEKAKSIGVSLNEFINRAIQMAVM